MNRWKSFSICRPRIRRTSFYTWFYFIIKCNIKKCEQFTKMNCWFDWLLFSLLLLLLLWKEEPECNVCRYIRFQSFVWLLLLMVLMVTWHNNILLYRCIFGHQLAFNLLPDCVRVASISVEPKYSTLSSFSPLFTLFSSFLLSLFHFPFHSSTQWLK